MCNFLKKIFNKTNSNKPQIDFFNSTPAQKSTSDNSLNSADTTDPNKNECQRVGEQDDLIINLLVANRLVFFNIILPLFHGVKDSWIDKEEKINLIRDAYDVYSKNIGFLEKLYSKINELDSIKKKQLLLKKH